MKKYCAFTTSDDKYAVYAATSLLSIRKQNPNIDLFIIGRYFSKTTIYFLEKNHIENISLDLSDKFHTAFDYPIECYYIFSGPEILVKKGYSHSLYIDGDIYCNNDPLNNIGPVGSFAGVPTGNVSKILANDYPKVLKLFELDHVDQKRIQTGILYFNNSYLQNIGFLEQITSLYDFCINNNIPRKGDDSLFALYQLVYPNIGYKYLPNIYNYIETTASKKDSPEWRSIDKKLLNNIVFYHFTSRSPKPWVKSVIYPNKMSVQFARRWRILLNKGRLRLFFSNIPNPYRYQKLK